MNSLGAGKIIKCDDRERDRGYKIEEGEKREKRTRLSVSQAVGGLSAQVNRHNERP